MKELTKPNDEDTELGQSLCFHDRSAAQVANGVVIKGMSDMYLHKQRPPNSFKYVDDF